MCACGGWAGWGQLVVGLVLRSCVRGRVCAVGTHGGAGGMAGEGGVGGDAYSSWCPTTWVDAEADAQVGGHVSGHTVGGAHNASWESSAVPELPSLPDLWMSSLTDSASSAEEDNIKRDAPSSPPLEPPKSPPNDNTVCKLEVCARQLLIRCRRYKTFHACCPHIARGCVFCWPRTAEARALARLGHG